MASTNKTTHYELSQYIGSDKPSYLGDYNSDMNKIDTGINTAQTTATAADGKADTVSTNLGNIENLTTSTKTSAVAAINEVDGHADTAQETANTAATNATQALGTANDIQTYLRVGTRNVALTSSNMSLSGTGTIDVASNLHIVTNNDRSLAKIYGTIFVNNMSGQSTVTITGTGFNVDNNITISNCGFVVKSRDDSTYLSTVDPLSYNINSNGTITFNVAPWIGNKVAIHFLGELIFVEDFND